MDNNRKIEAEHPGLILKEEFMESYGVSAYRLAKETGIDKMTLNRILKGKRAFSPKTALKISKFFGLSERFWINLQSDHDFRTAKNNLEDELKEIATLPEAINAQV